MKYIILFLLLIPLAQATEERAALCISCHNNFGVDVYKWDKECGNCHQFLDSNSKLNIPLFEEGHNPDLCGKCHGIKDQNSYHLTHGNVSCEKCHGSDIIRPEIIISDCAGCHGVKVHDIHQDNLDNICYNCHGSRPASDPKSESSVSTTGLTAGIYAKVVNYKQFTLYEIFQRIHNLLIVQ